MNSGGLCNRVLKLMGNRFEFTVIAADKQSGEQAIDQAIEEVKRIEEILSTFRDSSQANKINRFAGIKPVKVDEEVLMLIERSNKISALTDGAFDITYGSLDKSFWNFDLNMTALPDKETALKTIGLINYRDLIINKAESTVMLKNKGMRIGFGGIGKGYAADRAKQILQGLGIKSGIVNAAGDLVTWGRQLNGSPWTIGIADPDQSDRPFSSLNISNMAIATSGNYEKYVIINGKRYSHTIDPKTGFPVSGIKSVSIICPSAELADALATPVIVMGVRVGLNLINQLNRVGCVIIDDLDKVYTSKKTGNSFGFTGSYSYEYDYQSIGAGFNLSRLTKDKNTQFDFKFQAFLDKWMVILPVELRPIGSRGREDDDDDDGPRTPRNSFNSSFSISQVISQRLQAMLIFEPAYQEGLLATRYQRNYFTDGSVRAENLPGTRLKLPIGLRLNYFPDDHFIIRAFYRYYTDNWGIKAHTAEMEVPVKISPFFSVSPFYRYNKQSGTQYFAPYGQHNPSEQYFTSDYDLSALSSDFFGSGIRFAPPKGVFGVQRLNMLELRYGHYIRSTKLLSDVISLNLKFK